MRALARLARARRRGGGVKMRYPATFIPLENGRYDVVFADLPECHASGGNFEDAMAGAVAALARHVDNLIGSGGVIPEPSSLDELLKNGAQDERDLIYKLIPLEMGKADAKNTIQRLSISMRSNVLSRLDHAAKTMGLSRSALIALAVNEYCQRRQA